jgi:hypothetical protein
MRSDNINEVSTEGLRTLVKTWSTGGFMQRNDLNATTYDENREREVNRDGYVLPHTEPTRMTWRERFKMMADAREEKRLAKIKMKLLKEAAKVNVDYRPVMSAIINDYLFRCPR